MQKNTNNSIMKYTAYGDYTYYGQNINESFVELNLYLSTDTKLSKLADLTAGNLTASNTASKTGGVTTDLTTVSSNSLSVL
jgi:hypothetical protein